MLILISIESSYYASKFREKFAIYLLKEKGNIPLVRIEPRTYPDNPLQNKWDISDY